MFGKVLYYDRALGRMKKWNVFIVGAPVGDSTADALAQSFREVGIQATIVRKDEALQVSGDGGLAVAKAAGGGLYTSPDWNKSSSVVYVLPHADIERLKAFCASAGILSISGMPRLAEKGQVSVAVASSDSGTEIVVNLKRLKEEGHQLSAELLRLARVVR